MLQPLADRFSSYVPTDVVDSWSLMLAATTQRPLVVRGEGLL